MTYKTGAEITAEAKSRVRELSAPEAMQAAGANTVFLDCREPNEWNLGRLPGAVFIPRGTLEGKVEGVIPREKQVIVYCARGNRSALAADTLQQMGYTNVASMKGGIRGWMDAGGDIES